MNFNYFFSFSRIIKCNKCLRTLLTHLDSRMQHLMMTLRKIATKCDVSPTSCQMKTLLPQHRTPSKGRKASSRPFATRGLPVFQVKIWHVIDYKKTKLKRLAVSQKMGNRRSKKGLTKAELQQVGIFLALNFLPLHFLLIKKLEIEKTKTT